MVHNRLSPCFLELMVQLGKIHSSTNDKNRSIVLNYEDLYKNFSNSALLIFAPDSSLLWGAALCDSIPVLTHYMPQATSHNQKYLQMSSYILGKGEQSDSPWLRSTDFYKREMQGVLRIYNRETGPKLAKLSDN